MAKLTPKMDLFCQAVIAGSTQSDAYRAAYAAQNMNAHTVSNKASLLMKHEAVRARLDAIRKPVIEKLQYGLEQAMQEAQEAFEVARSKENAAAMVSAVVLRAKLNGLMVDKVNVSASVKGAVAYKANLPPRDL